MSNRLNESQMQKLFNYCWSREVQSRLQDLTKCSCDFYPHSFDKGEVQFNFFTHDRKYGYQCRMSVEAAWGFVKAKTLEEEVASRTLTAFEEAGVRPSTVKGDRQ